MNSKGLIFVATFALSLLDCEQSAEVSIPMFPDGGLLRTGRLLSREQLYLFEGMFDVPKGSDVLGAQVAVRSSKGTISLLTDKNAGFSVLGAACLPDGRVVAEGYWQYPTLVEAGLVRLFVDPPEVAEALCAGYVPAPPVELRGYYGRDNEFPREPFTLIWKHELKPWRGTFYTVAHHGACENTDHCGASSNSLESIRLAERIGSNAAEIDVRLTRDGVPILFHDPGLSKSLVRGLFCNGQVKDLSFAELRGSCQLRYGELIPTVEEALEMMINDTEMEGAYLDVKEPEGILPAARVASRTLAQLAERNSNADPNDDRRFAVLIAITTDEARTAWHAAKPQLESEGLLVPPCLVEYDPDVVLAEGCTAWGPTWTEGPQSESVQRLQSSGAATIFWTINQSEFIDEFLKQAKPNGIISARASLLFYRYQTLGTPPRRPDGTHR
ncbi:MAG: glycerophosphodiester phosphodiesterase family protein [Polyangiaceae bacterium]